MLKGPSRVFAACFFSAGACATSTSGENSTPELCEQDALRCDGDVLVQCAAPTSSNPWEPLTDCATSDFICSAILKQCATCEPTNTRCTGQVPERCREDGSGWDASPACDTSEGLACEAGRCLDLCDDARDRKSNVGCTYWAVDLDNATISDSSNAAAQQFAVVVSNPHAAVPVRVTIEEDPTSLDEPSAPITIAEATLAPLTLRTFKLGPKEIDGSAPGTFNTGTHTALTRGAFRVTADFPVVAYQFNPLENSRVFSNDASLLKPVEALDGSYVVLGWPQTIAVTDNPDTNFSALDPTNLRAFLTIVGTAPDTTVKVTSTTAALGSPDVAPLAAGGTLEMTLGLFEVLNLETEGFMADFTGSVIEASAPIAVFSGSEASDAPRFETLSERRCCADHLEEQLDPRRTAGKSFVVPHSPSRTRVVVAAGATIGVVPEPDYIRVIAASKEPTTVTTTLPPPYDSVVLSTVGQWVELEAFSDFMITATAPVHVGQVTASQEAAGIRRGLPGGDPSLVVIPPVEQYRTQYVFLTPDKYAFDFVSVVVPPGSRAELDGLPFANCQERPADGLTEEARGTAPPFVVMQCQLSFATIDPDLEAPDNLTLGEQSDGVHVLRTEAPSGLVVSGFDSFVSYGYAGGTELKEIAPAK